MNVALRSHSGCAGADFSGSDAALQITRSPDHRITRSDLSPITGSPDLYPNFLPAQVVTPVTAASNFEHPFLKSAVIERSV
jgi:hypothetical protein